MENNKDLSYCFRFIGVDEKLIKEYRDFSSCCEIKESKYFKDKVKKVLTVYFRNEEDIFELKNFVSKYINEVNCDIMVSVSSDMDSQIIGFPKNLLKAITELNVDVTLSYTILE